MRTEVENSLVAALETGNTLQARAYVQAAKEVLPLTDVIRITAELGAEYCTDLEAF